MAMRIEWGNEYLQVMRNCAALSAEGGKSLAKNILIRDRVNMINHSYLERSSCSHTESPAQTSVDPHIPSIANLEEARNGLLT